MSTLSPFTGFGDDQHNSIKFGLLMGAGGQFAQWTGGPRLWQAQPSVGDRVITQHRGRTPWRVSWRLYFETIADYELMDAMQGQRSTLRYLAGLTASVGGVIDPILDTEYQHLPGTLLVSLTDVVVEVGGTVEATATFERSYVAPVVPEPQPWPEPPIPAQAWPYGSGDYGDAPYGYGEPLPPEEP